MFMETKFLFNLQQNLVLSLAGFVFVKQMFKALY